MCFSKTDDPSLMKLKRLFTMALYTCAVIALSGGSGHIMGVSAGSTDGPPIQVESTKLPSTTVSYLLDDSMTGHSFDHLLFTSAPSIEHSTPYIHYQNSDHDSEYNTTESSVLTGHESHSSHEDYDAMVNPSAEVKDEIWGSVMSGGFIRAVIVAFSMIMVSELGDKTFFLAAILAMKNSRVAVFFGAMSALVLMTGLSVGMGIASSFIPKAWVHYGAIVLFEIFGIKMLIEGWRMSGDIGQEEYEEVEKLLTERKGSLAKGYQTSPTKDIDKESQVSLWTRLKGQFARFGSLIFFETFTVTFFAEWGDRSQFSTIALAAKEDMLGVLVGSLLGHGMCTGFAVMFGQLISKMVSVRTVTILGGILFILFALLDLIMGEDW